MTRDKQIKAYAKSLIKLCFDNGDFSEERVSAALATLEKNPPRNYVSVLKAFGRLVESEIAKQTADVEYAGTLSSSAVETLKANLSESYGRTVKVQTRQNDALIAGIRVRVGCDVFETSIAGALQELQTSLS